MGLPRVVDPALLTPPLSGDELPREEVSSKDAQSIYFERKMGDTELSYFLPSRESGVNDMCVCGRRTSFNVLIVSFRYLHLGFKAPERLVTRARVRAVWAILRLRHPLLAAHAQMQDYDDVRFV